MLRDGIYLMSITESVDVDEDSISYDFFKESIVCIRPSCGWWWLLLTCFFKSLSTTMSLFL